MIRCIIKAMVTMAIMAVAILAGNAWAVVVTTLGELNEHRTDQKDIVYVGGLITLTTTLTTTCHLYILPGYQITLEGHRLYESGPHLSTGSYQQYVGTSAGYDADTGVVVYGEGGGTKEVLVSWFGNDYLAAKFAFRSVKAWSGGGIIRFTEGETYDFSGGGVQTDNDSNQTYVKATGAIFTGTNTTTPWFQFRAPASYSNGSQLWVWDGGKFAGPVDANGMPLGDSTCFRFTDTRLFEVKNVYIESFNKGMELDNTDSVNIHDNIIHKCNYSIRVPNNPYNTQNLTVTHNVISTADRTSGSPLRTAGIKVEQWHRKTRIVGNVFHGLWTEAPIHIYDRQSTQTGIAYGPAPALEIVGNRIKKWADYKLDQTHHVGQYAILLELVSETSDGYAALDMERNNFTTENTETSGYYGDNATAISINGSHGGTIDNNEFNFDNTACKQWAIQVGASTSGLVVGGGNHYHNAITINEASHIPVSASNWLLTNDKTRHEATTSSELAKTTVKGGTLGNRLGLKLLASGTKSLFKGTISLNFGLTTVIEVFSSVSENSKGWRLEAEIDNTPTTTTIPQKIRWVFIDGPNALPTYGYTTASETTTSDVDVKISTSPSAGSVAQETWLVEVQ